MMKPTRRLAFTLTLIFAAMSAGAPLVPAAESSPTLTARVPQLQSAPLSGHLKMGGANPGGTVIDATSRYLTWGGKPWMPVMGEFHFSRYPRAQWEEELLKMKAGGITVVATYLFWIHHEEEEGKVDWSGDRDIRAFIKLCARHGLLAYPRLGPWAHGECRNGGFPDWLLEKSKKEGFKTRSDDPRYLALVRPWYAQIAAQLKGLYWKDGGPIIGVQLENELTRNPRYILALKTMAREFGIDVPLYTMTGWGGAQVPQDEVIPLFGGYPDAFWDAQTTTWAREMRGEYGFNPFRQSDTIGTDLLGKAQKEIRTRQDPHERYPYLTCETGGGMQVSYTRRPVITADDVAALSLCKLGSGSNMPGYYMYHGGSHPLGKLSTMQESLASNYPNDLPTISYDFQAPLREYGQVNPSYDRLRMLHLFVNDFGSDLAPMALTLPVRRPAGMDDAQTLRWAVRSDGSRGFIFINNYQRIEGLPEHKDVRLRVELPGEALDVPSQPLTIPAGAYMIWPFNMDLDGALLKYATAQPLCRLNVDQVPYYVFFASPGVRCDFAFDARTLQAITGGGTRRDQDQRITLSGLEPPGGGLVLTVKTREGKTVKILVLHRHEASGLYKATIWGRERLFIAPALENILFDGECLRLQGTDPENLRVRIFPAPARTLLAGPEKLKPERGDLFTWYFAPQPPRSITAQLIAIAPPQPAGPVKRNAKGKTQAPGDADFAQAGAWKIRVPRTALEGIHELLLEIDYAGDVGRAYLGDRLIADDFYFGRRWQIGLRRFAPEILRQGVMLKILPLRKDAPVYIPKDKLPEFGEKQDVAEVRGVKAVPVYEAAITLK